MSLTPARAVEVLFTLVDADWKTANVAKPKMIQRETEGELRETIPNHGLLVFYTESGGVRISPRGNRMYRDDLVNVIVECHSLKSHEHLYQLMEEVLRTTEENTRTVTPYHVSRPLSYAEEYGPTFRYWRGNVRVEVSRVAIRTGYQGPGS